MVCELQRIKNNDDEEFLNEKVAYKRGVAAKKFHRKLIIPISRMAVPCIIIETMNKAHKAQNWHLVYTKKVHSYTCTMYDYKNSVLWPRASIGKNFSG